MPDVSKPARQLDDPYIFVSYAHLDRQHKYIIHDRTGTGKQKQLNRKVNLNIDYVCSDITANDPTNIFSNEIRLFNGLTHTDGNAVYHDLLKELTAQGYEEI